jgi:hypothetical protein
MVVIQVHVGQNLMDNVLVDRGFGANIITDDMRKWLGLPFPKPATYELRMMDQSLTKPMGIIWD